MIKLSFIIAVILMIGSMYYFTPKKAIVCESSTPSVCYTFTCERGFVYRETLVSDEEEIEVIKCFWGGEALKVEKE
jgi:hypothetical protein